MSFVATAPAKLVLLGEYAVLEGAPALVAAVDRRAQVTVAPNEGERWRFTSDLPGYPPSDVTWSAEGIRVEVEASEHDEWTVLPGTVIECVCDTADVQPWTLPPLSVHIESLALHAEESGAKLGLGSSAAVTVALASAMRAQLVALGHLDAEPAPEDALMENLWIHAEVQEGRGSGLDVAAATFGGLLAYQVEEDALQVDVVDLPPEVEFTAVWTGTSASTASFLDGMEAFEHRAPDEHARHMAVLAELARRGLDACTQGDADAWMETVRAWTPAMQALGDAAGLPIVAGAHAELAALTRGTETAYKPSGAGGGDVGLLFAPSADALAKSVRKAAEAGYRCLPLHVHPDGVKLRQAERPRS
ncbi:MAG: hypothetical protein QNJ90_09330 [Planctomycetota bacterium]|nr:hypothetical protein [Planctomycetota bacterium]